MWASRMSVSFSVYLGNGDGTLQNPTTNSSVFPYISSLVVGNFNHDDVPDLVSTSYQSYHCEFLVCHPQGSPRLGCHAAGK
jgi:hypothetical protein